MYLAVNKSNSQDVHSFEWSSNNKLIINNQEVNPNDWEIIDFIEFSGHQKIINMKNRESYYFKGKEKSLKS